MEHYKGSEQGRMINSLCQENMKSYRKEMVFEQSLAGEEELVIQQS